MVAMEEINIQDHGDSRFVCDALEVVKLKFVNAFDVMESCEEYAPEFAHQHFGEKERIVGYEHLKVTINYTSASMYVYPSIVSKGTSSNIEPDDIIEKLKEQLPADQMGMMLGSVEEFQAHLIKQKRFSPWGDLLTKFSTDDSNFELFKVTESSPDFDNYLARVQSIALWYIDAAQYTDNTDQRWKHYFLFETKSGSEGDGSKEYALAGYASLYHFYAHPEKERVRIAQIMLLPQYRQGGNGAKLLQSIYNDIRLVDNITDVTVEDPADNFIYLRDYVDCINCLKLPEFATNNLLNGFSSEMSETAFNKLKMNKRQCRRVYEILRLMSTNQSMEYAMKDYRVDVKRRIDAPNRKTKRELVKMDAFEEEKAQFTSNISQDQRVQQLESLYQDTIGGYKLTISRLKTFPSIF